MDIMPILERFGFPVAVAVGVGYVCIKLGGKLIELLTASHTKLTDNVAHHVEQQTETLRGISDTCRATANTLEHHSEVLDKHGEILKDIHRSWQQRGTA